MSSSVEIREQKAALRKKIREEMKGLDEEEVRRQSQLVTSKILGLPEFQSASMIAIFLSMPGKEVSTDDIVRQALRQGKQVFVPYIYASDTSKGKLMDMFRLKDEEDLNSLSSDAWGIPSLSSDSIPDRQNVLGEKGIHDHSKRTNSTAAKLDIMFVPAMAFDSHFGRLGHGKGFYDRYLQKYCDIQRLHDGKMPLLVGLALEQQLLTDVEVPTTNDDWKVNQIITASSTLKL